MLTYQYQLNQRKKEANKMKRNFTTSIKGNLKLIRLDPLLGELYQCTNTQTTDELLWSTLKSSHYTFT